MLEFVCCSTQFPGPGFHCVKSVRIRNYSGLHFPAFGLNTEMHSDLKWRDTPYLSVFSPNTGKCGPE